MNQLTAWLSYVLGYGFAVVAGGLMISEVMRILGKVPGAQTKDQKGRLESQIPGLLGLVERALFVAAFQAALEEVIFVWRVLQWVSPRERGAWSAGKNGDRRVYYNVFVIGAGL